MKKLAIISSGGGMSCSFGAGVFLALSEKFKDPDILIADSGSSGTCSYYVADQVKSAKKIWESCLSNKKFINFHRFWRIIDIDYLIDEVVKKKVPLNAKKVAKSKIDYYIPALNEKTGNIEYFSSKDGVDIFELMRASMSMPMAFKMDPKIHINHSVYCDSLLSFCPESHVKKAVELGAKKILIVHNFSPLTHKWLGKRISAFWLFLHGIGKRYFTKLKKYKEFKPPKGVEVFILKPKRTLKVSFLDNNPKHLKSAVKQGHRETLANKKLKKFLKD